MAERICRDLTRIPPFNSEVRYATNNRFQKAGPKGFIQVKVLENNKLYVRVDLPGVPDDAVRHRVDDVRKKIIFFSGKTIANRKEGVREYAGAAGLGCDCCEITGVESKMKDGLLRMIVSRVKVKDREKKCTLTLPSFTGKSGRYLEDHPFVVKGRKGSSVAEPIADEGLYFSLDVPGVCADDVDVFAHGSEVRFYAAVRNVYEHDESGRIYYGGLTIRTSSPSTTPSLYSHTMGWHVEFGVLKIVIAPPGFNPNSE